MPSRSRGCAAIRPFAAECVGPIAARRVFPLDDRERLGRMLAALEPRLRAVALRITRHPESARDVVQSAFEKAIRHGAQFQGQSRVSTWLYRIVSNEALMWLRSQRRRGELQREADPAELASLPDAAPGPADRLQLRERARRLHAELGRLPAEERDVMLCCTLAEETYADYGARTGSHPDAVKSRAYRARRRLDDLLRD